MGRNQRSVTATAWQRAFDFRANGVAGGRGQLVSQTVASPEGGFCKTATGGAAGWCVCFRRVAANRDQRCLGFGADRQDLVGHCAAFFGDAIQIGLTATPKETKDISSSTYFGEPAYTYSLKQGIEDGFLAPYKVVKIDIDKERLGMKKMVANPWGVLPVVQIGDIVNDSEVTNLYLYDPLGEAITDLDGMPRVPARNDHYLCFHASSPTGDFVGMASRLDTDDDGLADHWEREGGGVDIDQDGTPELVLHQMGASVNKRDLFVEIDWTTLRTFDVPGEWDNYPRFRAIERVIEEFDKKNISINELYNLKICITIYLILKILIKKSIIVL